jgi:hypothetical protein
MDDALCVGFRVNPAFPNPPGIGRVQYKANDEVKRMIAVGFIASTTGLAIETPTDGVPRYLLLSGAAFNTAVETLSPDQLVWHNRLIEQASQNAEVVRDQRGPLAARAVALSWLWTHLTKASQQSSESKPALFLQPDVSYGSWDELLSAGTFIMNNKRPRLGVQNEASTYSLRVKGANGLITYVLACTFASYGLLRSVDPKLTQQFDNFLAGVSPVVVAAPAASTDSDSSGSDDEKSNRPQKPPPSWQDAPSSNRKVRKTQRRLQPLQTFVAQHTTADAINRLLFDTKLPLLGLSCTVTMRAWETRYTSCIIDNFQSIGCNTYDLINDHAYKLLISSKDELKPPCAKWVVNQYNGDATVSLFIRDDLKEEVVRLNNHAQTVLELDDPGTLRIRCTVQDKNSRGRVIPGTSRTICLNETMPVILPAPHDRRPPAVQSAASTAAPAPNSWAGRVQLGAKRAAEHRSVDHREKKEPKGDGRVTGNNNQALPHQQGHQQKKQQSQPKQQQQQQQHKQSWPLQPQQLQHQLQPQLQQPQQHPPPTDLAWQPSAAAMEAKFDQQLVAMEANFNQRFAAMEVNFNQHLETRLQEVAQRFESRLAAIELTLNGQVLPRMDQLTTMNKKLGERMVQLFAQSTDRMDQQLKRLAESTAITTEAAIESMLKRFGMITQANRVGPLYSAQAGPAHNGSQPSHV